MTTAFADPVATVFSGNPFDRADQRRQHPEWVADQLANPETRFLPFHQLKPLMHTDPGLTLGWRSGAQISTRGTTVFLGLSDGKAHFACGVAEPDHVDMAGEPLKFIDARTVAMQMGMPGRDQGLCGIIAQGRSMIDWHNRHGFCANCGAPTTLERAGYLRACAACGAQHFPRTDPVVIMLAVTKDRAVLGRPATMPKNVYTALAGFMEPGEDIEEAVRRELKEEAGLDIGRVKYVASQPWPFPSSLMIGCFGEALSEDISLDDDELEEAHWFDRAQLQSIIDGVPGPASIPPPMAIAHQLVRQWLEETAV